MISNRLATYIKGRYSQALDILKDGKKALELSKAKLGIVGQEGIFEQWLVEEKRYLESLAKEPPQETLQMEYCQRLTHLWQCEYVAFSHSTPSDSHSNRPQSPCCGYCGCHVPRHGPHGAGQYASHRDSPAPRNRESR